MNELAKSSDEMDVTPSASSSLVLSPEDRRREIMRAMRRCTPMQRKVLRVLPAHRSIWQAARAARISSHTISRWLGNSQFAHCRELLEQDALEEIGISNRAILRQLAAIGFTDPRRFYDDNGDLRPLSQLSETEAAAIAAIEVEEQYVGKGEERTRTGTLRKLRIRDPMKALELLGRHRRLWGEDAVKPAAPMGPGLSVIIQQSDGSAVGVQVGGSTAGNVVVNLPKPGG